MDPCLHCKQLTFQFCGLFNSCFFLSASFNKHFNRFVFPFFNAEGLFHGYPKPPRRPIISSPSAQYEHFRAEVLAAWLLHTSAARLLVL